MCHIVLNELTLHLLFLSTCRSTENIHIPPRRELENSGFQKRNKITEVEVPGGVGSPIYKLPPWWGMIFSGTTQCTVHQHQ